METKIRIYGASDDLIEVEGYIEDEVGCYEAKRRVKIECSDGTIARIIYDENGQWSIKVKKQGTAFKELISAVGDDKEHIHPDAVSRPSYSDILILGEGVEWVKIKGKYFKQLINV